MMGRGFFYYRRRMDRRALWRAMAFCLAVVVVMTMIIASVQMRPLLTSLATTKVSNTVTGIVYDAVNDTINNGEIRYDELVSFEKDNDGRITALKSNIAEFNRLQSQILNLILARVDQVSARELSIPIGTLTGAALLAGRGPRISVRMESVGSSSAHFQNEFVSAGINQTKHQIVLNIDVYVSVLLPGFSAVTKVSNSITVAETVIVGSVPDSYTYFSANGDLEQEASDFIINKSAGQ